MDNRTEVREFLVSRRAKISPEQAGLPGGSNRRVPGLRRSEVAALAGVSIEYYSKLERGALAGVSPSVLNAIARALQLDEAERAHLFDLARAADGSSALMRPGRTARQWSARPSLQWTLDAVTEGPAFVHNGRMDLLAGPAAIPATRSSTTWWVNSPPAATSSASDGAPTTSGTTAPAPRTSRHHIVGELTLAYEGLEMAAEPGLTLTIYTAEPGSPSEDALRLLASWAASQETDADAQTLLTE